MTKVAVVILNYNGAQYLEQFLPTVIDKSQNADIVVADNKSTDDSVRLLKEKFPAVKLIELDKNHGFAGGYNESLKQVDSDYYVLLNSDVEVTDNWLEPLLHFLATRPRYALCQPKIKNYNNRDKFEYAGACGGFIDSMGYPYCRGRIFDSTETDTGQYDHPVDIFWSSGACMMIRSEDFHRINGFDASFFAHMEEIDLCWRLRSLGYKAKAVPDSVVFHVGGGTLSYQSPFKTYLNFRNGLKLLLRNLPVWQLFIKIPVRFFLDWIAMIAFLIQGNGKQAISVLKAHMFVIRKIAGILKSRTHTSKIFSKKLILWDYYVLKKKKYSDQ
ncbi:MAG: glycosyltransferase family 2 protein [Ekhidna sp.]|nr:glycosyltransferase family 2 protein [Ekhidna sp.]MBC6409181.1 glycosyltransferase family 2 protein [Ekhidna sp.]MBC6426327.1 glycosyltransferase family 2 protein [Ekhidna sp.]